MPEPSIDQHAREKIQEVAIGLQAHVDRCGDKHDVIKSTLDRLEKKIDGGFTEMWSAIDKIREHRWTERRDLIAILIGVVSAGLGAAATLVIKVVIS